VTYYQLAHNYRDPDTKNIKAEIIHNFGRADKLDRKELVRLCRSIARICGIDIEDRFDENSSEKNRSRRRALPKDVKQIRTYPLGVTYVAEALWERLDIGKTLRAISKEKRHRVNYERALFALTANRLCEPESKLGVWDRWLKRVYLPDCEDLKLDQMYEAMDVLYENGTRLEESVFFKTADLLNLEVDVVFYDTASVSFAVDYADEEEDGGLRQFGRSKEGVWAPQVMVALAVTR
jgi:hypothetical protein